MGNLKVGDLAYFDGMLRLAKCKVISINGKSEYPSSSVNVEIQFTEEYTGYEKGKIITTSSIWVIPRTVVKKRKLGTRIGFYTVNLQGFKMDQETIRHILARQVLEDQEKIQKLERKLQNSENLLEAALLTIDMLKAGHKKENFVADLKNLLDGPQ